MKFADFRFPSRFKKTVLTGVLASLIASAGLQTQPRQAQALMGISSGNPFLILGGIALMGALPAFKLTFIPDESHVRFIKPNDVDGFIVLSFIASVYGIVLLDSPSGQGLQFSALNEVEGGKVGLTAGELEAFNNNLAELNAMAEAVEADANQKQGAGLEFIRDRWAEYSKELDVDALHAAQKVSAQVMKVLKSQEMAGS